MQFAKNVSAQKNVEWSKFVNDDLPNHDLPKSSSYFDVFSIFYTVKKTSNDNLPNDNLPNEVLTMLTSFSRCAMTDNTELNGRAKVCKR